MDAEELSNLTKLKNKCIIKISSNITDKVRNFCCGLFP